MSAPSVLDLYYDLVASGDLECDPAQEAALEELDALARRLHDYKLPGKPNPLKRLFARKPDPQIRGLYIWGSVGRGKTMMMDLFYESGPGGAEAARAFPRLPGRRQRAFTPSGRS